MIVKMILPTLPSLIRNYIVTITQGGILVSEVTHRSFLMCAAPFASTVTARAAKVTLVLKLFCKFFRDFDNIIKGQGFIL